MALSQCSTLRLVVQKVGAVELVDDGVVCEVLSHMDRKRYLLQRTQYSMWNRHEAHC